MIATIFSQAVDQAFPDVNPNLRGEISHKVTIHMLEYLREQVYLDDPEGFSKLQDSLQRVADVQARSSQYGEAIMTKLASLSEEKRQQIQGKFDEELTRVMHEIYVASS